MPKRPTSILTLFVSLAILSSAPSLVQAETLIDQTKANAGNVTPGDAPGFPVTLSLPGSYELASNLQPPANKAGIQIASNDVRINLSGFRLNGAAGATTGIYGAAFKNVSIRNGTITGFDAHGIYGSGGDNWIVESMRVTENGAHGIFVSGTYSIVRASSVTQNGGRGIHCTVSCLVADSIVSANGAFGISINSGTLLGNVILSNVGVGIAGTAAVGFGNNTLALNNGGGANPQVTGSPFALHPNACDPACP